ncbi:MAG TPA: MnhB domain-containing protein [Mycobacteriales bacterium]|nr:MnhB domain-containing protein [Mycobacteriales bacterium]
MSGRGRAVVFAVVAAALAAVLGAGFAGLPSFGTSTHPYGDAAVHAALALRHTANAVGSVTFDQRGLDTLGEEFILLSAVLGATLLLRPERGERPARWEVDQAPSLPAVARGTALVLLALTFLLAISVVLHGHLTPGGGFQGGVIAASSLHLLYVGGGPSVLSRFRPEGAYDLLEAAGAAAYVVVGLGGLVASGAFLANDVPHGSTGAALSAGTVPLLNIAVGLEVGAGVVLLLSRFLRQEELTAAASR